MAESSWRVTRRSALGHATVAAAGVAAASGMLSVPALAARATRSAANPFILNFLPWGGWPAYAGSNWRQFIQPAFNYWEASNHGVKVVAGGPQGGNTSILSSILAGNGPDVFQDWVMPPYLEAGAALNLKPFLQQENIPLTTWSPGQMRTMQTDTGIWALPTYVHCDAIAVNLSLLDQLGLKYPSEGWDYNEAAQLARAAVGTQGKTKVYGWCSAWGLPWSAEYTWPFHLWGGAARDATATVCTADQPNAYKGLEWYMNMYWEKVLTPGGDSAAATGSIYNSSGTISAFQECGANQITQQLRDWRNNIKWTFWPMPKFPGGQASFEADDFYMANAGTKNVEATLSFMKFLTADPYWQRYNFKYLLRTPSMVSMWDEWVATLEQVSPVARGKNLAAYKDAAQNYAVAPRYFKYDDTTVEPILSNAINNIAARKGDPVVLLTQAAKQITTHETIAATSSSSVAATLNKVASAMAAAEKAHGNYSFPAPSVTGTGTPAVKAPAGTLVVKNHTYTIIGSGSNFGGGKTDDGLTFAYMPWTKATGTFTCRLVGVSEVKGKALGSSAKVGIMARGDLSTQGTYVTVDVALGHGVQVSARPIPASVSGDHGQGNTTNLLGSSAFMASLSGSGPNYVAKPIWLRLVRDITHWTPYASLDGKNWQLQSGLVGMEATGVWIGLVVSPNGNSPQMQAVFDNVSFTPTAAVQIGS